MLDDLLLHARTRSQCRNFLARPTHALLITGPEGSGKETLVTMLAATLLNKSQDQLSKYPYYTNINPAGPAISIEDIRELQQFIKLRAATGTRLEGKIARVIIIQHAERMRQEAQNALLKTLEEPPTDTVICLTASNAEALRPTIRSRCRELAILPVSIEEAQHFLQKQDIDQFYALSQGHTGLLMSLINETDHPLLEYIKRAKDILGMSVPARLQEVDALAKDKPSIIMLLNALQRIAHAALQSVGKKNDYTAVRKWHTTQAATVDAINHYQRNANPKLLLDDLFMNL